VPRAGWHRLSFTFALVHGALLVATLPAYPWLGLDVDWRSALPLIVFTACVLVAWAYYAFTPATAFERALAETVLVLGLLVALGVIIPPAQYAAAALGRPLIDPVLASADAALGVDVRDLAAWTRAHPTVSRWLTHAYFSLLWQFALIVPVLGVALRDRRALWEYAFHFHFCSVVTLMCFALFPAACAFSYYGFESTIPQTRFLAHFEGVRAGTLTRLEFGRMEGLVSMPSFHVAGAMMITWVCRRHRWLLVPLLILNVALTLATFMSGAHYVVDTLGTVLMVAASVWLWNRWGASLLDSTSARRPLSL
jgi:hypothetical protein